MDGLFKGIRKKRNSIVRDLKVGDGCQHEFHVKQDLESRKQSL